jgi:hypothetical protein
VAIRLLALTLGLLTVGGCSSREYISPVYDTCFDLGDCVSTAEACEELTVDFAGISYTNAICTDFCEAEGPVSPDCPRAFIGRNGSCYPSFVAGGVDDALVCLEPCDVTGDCLLGFRCLGAEDLCPNDPTCPMAVDDRICVPGPL